MSLVVGFLGMTHLGLNSAVAGAERGHKIVCFDYESDYIASLRRANSFIEEPNLSKLLKKNLHLMNFTDCDEKLRQCDLVYIAADVDTDEHGASDLSPVETYLDTAIKNTNDETTLVVLSQVPPGFVRSHKKPNRQIAYQVETLIFGNAISRALNPERYIIGLDNADSKLPRELKSYLESHGNPPIFKMSYESAELAKTAINCCLVSSISTANMFAEICEHIGANWQDIVPALRADKRIGQYSYLSPGLGLSGGNLERDVKTVIEIANTFEAKANIAQSWLDHSNLRRNWPLEMIASHVFPENQSPVIGILGLTYKENTNSIKNSPSVKLIKELRKYKLQVYDPIISCDPAWHETIENKESVKQTCLGADVILIMTAWPEFHGLKCNKISRWMRGKVVIDPFSILNSADAHAAGLKHIVLGKKLK